MSEIETYIDPVGPSGSFGWANTTTSGSQTGSQTAALSGGGYVVVRQDTSAVQNSGVPRDFRGQLFNAGGQKIGSEFVIDQSGTVQVRSPSVAATANASSTQCRAFSIPQCARMALAVGNYSPSLKRKAQ
jgi:hypothetical protein